MLQTEISFFLSTPVHFSFRECSWYLDRNYDDCMYTVRKDGIRKALRMGGRPLLVHVREEPGGLRVAAVSGDGNKADAGAEDFLRDHVEGWLDLGRDLQPFYRLLEKDRRLSYMAKDFYGLRVVGIPDLWEALCWSIIGQQINLRFAYSLKRRLVERYGTLIRGEGEEAYYLFPDPDIVKDLDPEELRPLQFSQSKAKYLIGLAGVFARGELSREMLETLPDLESRQQLLMRSKGIGIWTANYSLMKTLRESSCIPWGDTGLLTALANHGIIRERKELAKIERFFAKFKGWESYLVFYLWRSLSGELPPV